MIKVKVKAEALQPLILGDGSISNQNVRNTLDHITGGMIRGAIAQTVLERIGTHSTSRRTIGGGTSKLQQLFDACFPKVGGARFGFLYPGEGEVMPGFATALRCRNDGSHLFDMLIAKIHEERVDLECPTCNEKERRLERERGYLTWSSTTTTWIPVKSPPKRSFVRVGLNRMTETAEDRFLYVLEALEPTQKRTDDPALQYTPVVFSGDWWFASAEEWHSFEELIKFCLVVESNSCYLKVGSARARGFGNIRLTWRLKEISDIGNRVAKLDKAIGKDHFHFTLMAISPVIALDADGQPARNLSPDLLRRYLPDLPDSVRIVPEGTIVERENVSGWSQAWGLPKPLIPAIARGSVFTYAADRNHTEDVLTWLKHLLLCGIGERTQEGYGQIEVSNPFHVDKAIRWQSTK